MAVEVNPPGAVPVPELVPVPPLVVPPVDPVLPPVSPVSDPLLVVSEPVEPLPEVVVDPVSVDPEVSPVVLVVPVDPDPLVDPLVAVDNTGIGSNAVNVQFDHALPGIDGRVGRVGEPYQQGQEQLAHRGLISASRAEI